MTNIATRQRLPEIMDQPGLDAREHENALAGLGRINALSRSAAIYWPGLTRLARAASGAPLRVLDLASGGGDVSIALAVRAAREGLALEVEGCDVNNVAIEFARRRAAEKQVGVRFFTHDALQGPLPEGYDVVICSLFLHHLDNEQAVDLLRRMADAARAMVLVNDLVRSRLGRWLALAGCHLLTRSHVVHYDGPVSVSASYTPAEALALADRAGLHGVVLTRHWPQRFLLTWTRS